jgi:biopolymer transport protein ExbD
MSLGSIDKCEPNLVPMLDLVLQLVMFFMLVANFIQDDLVNTIKLPTAIQAKPLDKSEDHVIFLNVDKQGRVLLAKDPRPGDILTNAIQVQNYLKDRMGFDVARKAREEKVGKPGRVSLVVIRADKDCHFKQINDVMDACRRSGYTDIQLRAIVQNSATN